MKPFMIIVLSVVVLSFTGCPEPSVTSQTPDADNVDLSNVPLAKPQASDPTQAKKIADQKMKELANKAGKGKKDAKDAKDEKGKKDDKTATDDKKSDDASKKSDVKTPDSSRGSKTDPKSVDKKTEPGKGEADKKKSDQ